MTDHDYQKDAEKNQIKRLTFLDIQPAGHNKTTIKVDGFLDKIFIDCRHHGLQELFTADDSSQPDQNLWLCKVCFKNVEAVYTDILKNEKKDEPIKESTKIH